jgi:hypothetical protein
MVTIDRLLVGEGGFDRDFRIIRNRSHKQSHLRTRTGKYVGGDSYVRSSIRSTFINTPHHDCQSLQI